MSGRKRIVQTELPRVSIQKALRVPRALVEQYAGQPTAPVEVAVAVGVKPSSSGWRALTGAAIGYGLTDGGYNAPTIALTDLGRRAVAPQEEGEDVVALREACLKPLIIGGFLRKYDGNKFPREDIARNVLKGEFAVPDARVGGALETILENAETIGAFRTIGGDRYVSLAPLAPAESAAVDVPQEPPAQSSSTPSADFIAEGSGSRTEAAALAPQERRPVRAIFVGHSSGTKVLEQVKQLLELAEVRAEVAVEQETAAIPVPDKVFEAMSRSDAAIICVTADAEQQADNRYSVNPNVLIEIGAAYVRHDKKLVLLWDRRVEVPSNLQGLYRCEFEGDELSWEAGTKLQKALIAIKKGEVPS
ncbi:MAG: hypothetical protein F4230_11730 [Holophagales bacterium]|nr:hypothetical protein [Holophagales bacterium]MYF05592.1 hypothetical protein [Holophagales bacterium]MYJ24042.1 hypothetical protein [Holophagales bacterium]